MAPSDCQYGRVMFLPEKIKFFTNNEIPFLVRAKELWNFCWPSDVPCVQTSWNHVTTCRIASEKVRWGYTYVTIWVTGSHHHRIHGYSRRFWWCLKFHVCNGRYLGCPRCFVIPIHICSIQVAAFMVVRTRAKSRNSILLTRLRYDGHIIVIVQMVYKSSQISHLSWWGMFDEEMSALFYGVGEV